MTHAYPSPGEWFRDGDDQPYEIVCVDEEEWFVEIQYLDGTVEELDLADWDEGREKGEIVRIEPPL